MVSENYPLVTVLTPVYNGADYLAECIESVLGQTYQNFEYIIVNNCSSDASLEIARTYATRDRRVRIHTNDKFVDVIENHNTAFRLMSPKAKYCKVVSADDFIFPDCILRMVEFSEVNPTAGFVGAYQVNNGGVVKWQGFNYPNQVFAGVELCRAMMSRRQAFVDGQPIFGFGTPTSLLYRADLVRDSDEFYPNPSPHSDTSACFRYLGRCDFGFIHEILSFERIHERRQTSKSVEMHRHVSAYLSDLIEYGPHYLKDDELKSAIDSTLRDYHRILAKNVFKSRDRTFWDYHRGRLQELGYPLSAWTLFKAVARAVGEQGVQPLQGLGRLAKRAPPTT